MKNGPLNHYYWLKEGKSQQRQVQTSSTLLKLVFHTPYPLNRGYSGTKRLTYLFHALRLLLAVSFIKSLYEELGNISAKF